MSDQQQRTQWALDMFRSFVDVWVAPGASRLPQASGAQHLVEEHIRSIAPKDDSERHVGYGVFRREVDADWDIRQRPSGWVHTLISAVFDKPGQAENAHAGASERHPDQQFIICEIREVP